MYWTTDCDWRSDLIAFGKVVEADLASVGVLLRRSVASLSGPALLISVLRSLIVGVDATTSGRRTRRNFARSLLAGLDALTSTVRSASVERRFTNVVFALRSVVGSWASVVSSAVDSSAIAPAVWFVLDTSAERSSRFAATAVTSSEESVRNRWSVGWSFMIWLTSASVVDRNGLKYFADRFASSAARAFLLSVRPSYWIAKPWITFCRPLRVFGSSVSKSWSRSTMEVVFSVPSVAPSSSFLLLLGPGVSWM